MFALKLAFRPWKLQPLSQLLTFITLTTLLLLAGFFGSLTLSLPEIRKRLDGDHVASVFIDPALETSNLRPIQDQIHLSLGSSPVSVEFIDSDTFLETIRTTQPELAKEVAALGGEKEWVAPKFFSLRGTLNESIIESLRLIPGVEAVSFSGKRFKPILENIAAIEWLSRVLFGAILLAMVAILTLLGRLNASIFHEAEGIVAQMGGTDAQARFPSRLNPILLAGGAGVLSSLILLKLNPWFIAKMVSLSPYLRGMESVTGPTTLALLGLGFMIGVLATLVGPTAGIKT